MITSGPVPPDPGRVLESQRMRQLIKDLAQQFDVVVLDSPPILVVNDAIILAGYVDSSVFILESGRTTRRTLSQAIDLLKQARIQPAGILLNKLKTGRSGYYYSYYRTDYYKT